MTVIEVDGVRIEPDRIRAEAALLREEARQSGRAVTPEEGLRYLAEAERVLIDRVLLEREVERAGIVASDDEIESALALLMPRSDGVAGCRAGIDTPDMRGEVARRLQIDKLVDLWTSRLPRPSAKAIRDAYQRNREQFWRPEFIFVSQIIKNVFLEDEREAARAAIERAAEELDRGADFANTADAFSDCPGAGGRMGYITRGEMVPEFEDVVFNLPLNKISPVFETRFGFHIAKVTGQKAAGIRPFSEVAQQIGEALIDQGRERELESRMRTLRTRAVVRRVKV